MAKKTKKKKTVKDKQSLPTGQAGLHVKKGRAGGFFQKKAVHIILIILLGILVYSNTFKVPFIFDDKLNIADNPAIKDLGSFMHFSKAVSTRFIGFLSFAINYKLNGLNVTGYHIFNLLVHIINALLVYYLVVLTFKTPFLRDTKQGFKAGTIALFSGLLFVCHPIQTQAVTYIVQRFASLAALFYLLSLVMYIKARLGSQNTEVRIHKSEEGQNEFNLKPVPAYRTGRPAYRTGRLFYPASFISAILAMKTKEIAFTLPVVITLYEFMFFEGNTKKRMLYLLPIVLTMFIIPMNLISANKPIADLIGELSSIKETTLISKTDYLFTQFRVIVTYIRLLFFPINQNLDYDYPVFHSFLNINVFSSFVFLLSIFGIGAYLYYRSRITHNSLRIIAFGIFWFFITLSVESSIIPIRDVIFEHRVYLPSAGVFIALTASIYLAVNNLKNKWLFINKAVIPAFALIIIILSVTAHARNTVWKDEITLWEDVAKKSSQKARAYYNLGVIYTSKGITDKAIENHQTAIRLKPDYAGAYYNLGNAYASKGLLEKAVEEYQTAIRLKPDFADAYYNLGYAYGLKGMTDKGIENYRTAIRLKPDYAEAYINLGVAYGREGLTDKAIESFHSAIKLNPDYAEAYNNLGYAYASKGLLEKAVEEYQTALRLKPDYAEARINLEKLSKAMKGKK